MPKLIFLCLVIASGDIVRTRAARSDHYHHPVKHGQRIINGTRTPHSIFPFLVSIQAYNRSSGDWVHGCGGSIVNAITILTACHCVAPKILGNTVTKGNNEIMRVVAGTGNLKHFEPSVQITKVKDLIAHQNCSNFPQYDDGWYNHDVGFIILSRPLVFTPEVQPMRVYSTDLEAATAVLKQMVYRGADCYVPGWGTTVEFKGLNSEFVMVSAVHLIPPTQCRDLLCQFSQAHCHAHFDKIGQVCGVSKFSSDCQGDSGGPLVCNGMVFGTVSYGERCLPGWPSVFQSIKPILQLMMSTPTQQLVRQQVRSVGTPLLTYPTGRNLPQKERKFQLHKTSRKPNPNLMFLGLTRYKHIPNMSAKRKLKQHNFER